MNRVLAFILPFFLLSFTHQTCPLRNDGIYTASVDAETDAHIRFYPDGIVIVSTSVKNIKDVKTWFHKDNMDRVLKGKYKSKKSKVRFTVKGETGEQQFEGLVGCEELTVTVTDVKSKASTQRIYKFIAI